MICILANGCVVRCLQLKKNIGKWDNCVFLYIPFLWKIENIFNLNKSIEIKESKCANDAKMKNNAAIFDSLNTRKE